uniref:ABC1 atypical kinase-like domain-containing protein n=1 Tax=Xenopsylla cheopis TaxID=163159 RepID=A0A6M2DVZ1_XENCH
MNYARKTSQLIYRRGIRTKVPTDSITPGTARKKRIHFYVTAGVLGTYGAIRAYNGDSLVPGGAIRFSRSLLIGLQISWDYYWSLLGIPEDSDLYNVIQKDVHGRCADRLVQGCLKNGGIYIKIGQGLSSLNHILPEEYTFTLSRLHDKCLIRSSDELDKLFIEDFGSTPEQLFKEFQRDKPIAAASLAQVYRATTKDGRDVAVKVQYIDLQDRFDGDVQTVRAITGLVGWLHPNFKLAWILDYVENNLRQELDFVNEGKNAERCAKDLQHLKYVYVPQVFWDLTNMRVLTTEFIEGIKVNDKRKLQDEGLNLADIDRKLITAFSEQIFNTGFVHADPHPGNVLVRQSKLDGKAEIVLLDHGLYENVPKEVRSSLCDFWEGIVFKNYNKMQKHANELHVSDFETFAEILSQRPLRIESPLTTKTSLTQAELSYMTEMAKRRFNLIAATLKAMPHNLIFVIRNLNTVRAIARGHGDPVDRLRLIARTALRTKYGIISMLRFDLMMWASNLRIKLLKVYLKFLTFINRAPDTSHLLKNLG